MSVVLLVKPTERELQEAQEHPACAAYNRVFRAIPVPDFLVLQHQEPAINFTLRIAGARELKLSAALRLIQYLHSCTRSFGLPPTFGEQARCDDRILARSDDGQRMVYMSDLIVSQSEGDFLPEDISRLLKTLEVTDKATYSKLTLAHYVRLIEEDGTKKILEWRISNKFGDLLGLLN
ncbi:MAG: hypothetical protein NVSMB39_5040 [Candidatus Saccharimonadales bacterium]